MSRSRIIQLLSILAAAVCLVAAVLLAGPIRQQRQELQLTYSRDPAIPADIALTQAALGSFRGLAVDFMWYRATKLKDAGQYREANQLSRWICMLQPHFEKVWVFHAWNMAYNISVATHTPEERWDWVSKGIRLLRDKAVVANPDSVVIKKELGWIFFHKIGAMSDDMHWYYRRRLAAEWQQLLGSPEGATTEKMIDRMRLVAHASDTLDELRENESTARLLDHLADLPAVRGMRLNYQPDEKLMAAIGRILMFMMAEDQRFLGFSPQQVAQQLDLRIFQAMNHSEYAKGFEALVPYLRKKVLIEKFHMDPAEMLRLMEEYGPLDWRHPCSHSVYWAEQGVRAAVAIRNKQDVDQLNTDRLIIHSMQELEGGGRLSYDPISDWIDLMPDPRFIESYEKALGYAGDRVDTGDWGPRTRESYDTGYENFLLRVIAHAYLYGDEEQAKAYHLKWREKFKIKPDNAERLKMSIEELVMEQLEENSTIWSNRRQIVDALLRQAFLEGIAKARPDVFNKFLRFGRDAFDRYKQNQWATPIVDKKNRMALAAEFRELVESTFSTLLKQPNIPLVLRSRMWHRTDPVLRQAVYDEIRPIVAQHGTEARLDPQKVFPEPPGMEAYRKSKPVKASPELGGQAETPQTIERK